MRMLSRLRPLILLAMAAAMVVSLMGCAGSTKGSDREGIKFSQGKMIHLQQVLEHYDAGGSAVPQYLELWLTKDQGRCSELDKEGNELAVALDTGKEHVYYDAATLTAEKSAEGRLFIVNFSAMKKAYPKMETSNDGKYAGRDCTLYMMDTGKAQEWAKLYVDKQTGSVLFCDAETFRLRTALIEELPVDKALFAAPDGLKYKGGEGK